MSIHDRRTKEQVAATRHFVNATDRALSGWGGAAGGKSYYCVACATWEEAMDVFGRMWDREDFTRVMTSDRIRRGPGDHTAIVWHERYGYGK